MSFRDWSVWRILLLSVTWFLLTLAFLVWRGFRSAEDFSGKTGSGAVAFSAPILPLVAVLFCPPILLTAIWFLVRRASP